MPVLLAERGIIVLERREWAAAVPLAEEVMAIMRGGWFDDDRTSAVCYAWLARVALQRGNVPGAGTASPGRRLLHLLTYAQPVASVQALLEMGQAYATLADAAGGRRRCARSGHPPAAPDSGASRAGRGAPDTARLVRAARRRVVVTTAELRLLPAADPPHLPRDRRVPLHLRHTVKTQAVSVHRKLGVSTAARRSRLRELACSPTARNWV